jgi:outer membrane protein assembly factor BamB
MGGSGILDCLDVATGKRFWSHDVLKETGHANLNWGMSCSPLAFDDTVVVTGGRCDNGTVIAYRLSTGELLWKSGAEMASYASPLLATLASKRVILSLNAVNLTAHDPASGALLMAYRWANEKRPKASQPVVLPADRIFLSAGYEMGCVLLQVAANQEGQMTAAPIWRGLSMKTQFNSVAARDGFLYGLDDGVLCCVDLTNGKRMWKDGRYGSGQTLLVGDLILIQSERGAVALARATPERFQELGQIAALSSKTWNYPTLAGRYLLVRNDQECACYQLPVQTEVPMPGKR